MIDSRTAASRLQTLRRVLSLLYAVVAFIIPSPARDNLYPFVACEMALSIGLGMKLMHARQSFGETEIELSQRFSVYVWIEIIVTAPFFYFIVSQQVTNFAHVLWIVPIGSAATVCQLLAERLRSTLAWAVGVLLLLFSWCALFYDMMLHPQLYTAFFMTMLCFCSITPGMVAILRMRASTNEFTHCWTETVLRSFALLLAVLWVSLSDELTLLTA